MPAPSRERTGRGWDAADLARLSTNSTKEVNVFLDGHQLLKIGPGRSA